MKLIAQGAEAKLYRENATIIKERLAKAYRHPVLDESLRQFRTRREAKVLQKLEDFQFPAPHLREFSDKRMSIVMDFVPGNTLKEVLQQQTEESEHLAKEIGQRIGQLHQADVIHSDLTTSNMIQHLETKQVNLIDFGLSFFSEKAEDKAVDLFLLDRALETTHAELYPKIFEQVLAGYQEENPRAQEILERLDVVRKRGRNKKR
ncbi:MAG: KEOPS complex kinase/ATPase Bud32 [Nanoarchaeota archaeon]|nr:KEOPS complex kinase/ATPase Bud32 [Nanoarchaeota archaeon]